MNPLKDAWRQYRSWERNYRFFVGAMCFVGGMFFGDFADAVHEGKVADSLLYAATVAMLLYLAVDRGKLLKEPSKEELEEMERERPNRVIVLTPLTMAAAIVIVAAMVYLLR